MRKSLLQLCGEAVRGPSANRGAGAFKCSATYPYGSLDAQLHLKHWTLVALQEELWFAILPRAPDAKQNRWKEAPQPLYLSIKNLLSSSFSAGDSPRIAMTVFAGEPRCDDPDLHVT